MIIDKNDEESRYKALMDAFREDGFHKELEGVEKELRKWLAAWIKDMNRFDERLDNVYSIESRVKEARTFEEKLLRKDYIQKWDVSDSIKENQEYIRQNLTDLIGLRINCHFVNYEEAFYLYFKRTANNQNDFVFNFEENIIQKNGHTIYKFSGTYKGIYHFEVQIKSIVHNVWGEVEHKTVYKNPTYDGFFEQKKLISGTLHDVMLASDRELHTLFNMKETETQLLRSLFFIKTCDDVARKCRTKVLGEHYNSYFLAFPDEEPIKQYLVAILSGQEYHRSEVKVTTNAFYNQLYDKVLQVFPKFYLNCS